MDELRTLASLSRRLVLRVWLETLWLHPCLLPFRLPGAQLIDAAQEPFPVYKGGLPTYYLLTPPFISRFSMHQTRPSQDIGTGTYASLRENLSTLPRIRRAQVRGDGAVGSWGGCGERRYRSLDSLFSLARATQVAGLIACPRRMERRAYLLQQGTALFSTLQACS